jgi:lysophospholipase L1-like esterase
MNVRRIAVALVGLALGCTHPARTAGDVQWLGTWEAPPQLTEPRNLPPAPGLSGSTLRQVIHLSVGGSRFRLWLSNEFGDGPIVISSARVARSAGHDAFEPGSDVALRFRGSASTRIAVGAAVASDPFDLASGPLSDLTITLFISSMPAGVTGHPGSRTTSFLLAGDHVNEPRLSGAATTEHWYVIRNLEVLAPDRSAAVVVLGNSIADGRGSGTDKNDRWPDNVARRLHDRTATSHIAVLNAGIGGNAVVRGGLGPTALARLDRDVLDQAGAKWLILSEGVNDIGGAMGKEASERVARALIDAFQSIIARAHARHMRVYGATILPFGGSQYSSPDHEAARSAVNAWIRDSHAFDAVIDLDAAMRDPAEPTKLRSSDDSGDHLHPNEAGYRVMADAIDLRLFETR